MAGQVQRFTEAEIEGFEAIGDGMKKGTIKSILWEEVRADLLNSLGKYPPVVLSPQAASDANKAKTYYAAISLPLAIAFIEELNSTLRFSGNTRTEQY